MFDYAKARTNMVDGQIHTAGVVNPLLLQAFENVPRETFVPENRKTVSYFDEDLPLGQGRYLMEPITYGRLLQAADLKADDVVLDIGCASGYSSTILALLTSTVVAQDEDEALLNQCRTLCSAEETCNVIPFQGAHNKGCVENAPYNLIIINGAVAEIPAGIVSQLAPDGRLLTILRKDPQYMGQAVIVQRNSEQDDSFSSYPLFDAATPYLKGFEPKPGFSF